MPFPAREPGFLLGWLARSTGTGMRQPAGNHSRSICAYPALRHRRRRAGQPPNLARLRGVDTSGRLVRRRAAGQPETPQQGEEFGRPGHGVLCLSPIAPTLGQMPESGWVTDSHGRVRLLGCGGAPGVPDEMPTRLDPGVPAAVSAPAKAFGTEPKALVRGMRRGSCHGWPPSRPVCVRPHCRWDRVGPVRKHGVLTRRVAAPVPLAGLLEHRSPVAAPVPRRRAMRRQHTVSGRGHPGNPGSGRRACTVPKAPHHRRPFDSRPQPCWHCDGCRGAVGKGFGRDRRSAAGRIAPEQASRIGGCIRVDQGRLRRLLGWPEPHHQQQGAGVGAGIRWLGWRGTDPVVLTAPGVGGPAQGVSGAVPTRVDPL